MLNSINQGEHPHFQRTLVLRENDLTYDKEILCVYRDNIRSISYVKKVLAIYIIAECSPPIIFRSGVNTAVHGNLEQDLWRVIFIIFLII